MEPEIISQGAEARVRAGQFLGRAAVTKERFRKRYRLPALDERLTKHRVVHEVRCLVRARRAGVDTPCIFRVDTDTNRITMERVPGVSLRDYLDGADTTEAVTMAGKLGLVMAQLHDADIVHGDPTTSNFIVREDTESLCAIDFGLGATATLAEDKAVDLYVMERALGATHSGAEPLIAEALRVYKRSSRTANQVMQRLSEVRMRGRKRECFG